jgi:hypothetical protein
MAQGLIQAIAGRAALRSALVLATAVLAAACQSLGPTNMARDRLGYASAIGESWKEQMLLNIVKQRYLDTPVYLEVSSVVSSYEAAVGVNVAANVFPRASQASNGTVGATGSFTESPTVSYAPLTGERLVNSLLRPIPPETIFAMIAAGHSADFILRATVRALNGVYNRSTSPRLARREDPRFTAVTEAILRIEQAGALGVRIEKSEAQTLTYLMLPRDADQAVQRDIDLVKEALGIDRSIDELRLVYGAIRRRPDEIALLTRSMQELMGELATGVEVPEQDLLDGRATPRFDAGGDAARLLRVRSGQEQPADAYALARYRGRWFWIDDTDLRSKRIFMFLMMFSSMAETGALPQAPILTIPAR